MKAVKKTPIKKNPIGRKSKYQKLDLIQVERLSGLGLNDSEIAYILNICVNTLKTYKANHKDFLTAIKMGRISTDEKVLSSLFKNCTDGNVTAQIFWLCNKRPEQWKRNRDEQGSDLSQEYLMALKSLAVKTLENLI